MGYKGPKWDGPEMGRALNGTLRPEMGWAPNGTGPKWVGPKWPARIGMYPLLTIVVVKDRVFGRNEKSLILVDGYQNEEGKRYNFHFCSIGSGKLN